MRIVRRGTLRANQSPASAPRSFTREHEQHPYHEQLSSRQGTLYSTTHQTSPPNTHQPRHRNLPSCSTSTSYKPAQPPPCTPRRAFECGTATTPPAHTAPDAHSDVQQLWPFTCTSRMTGMSCSSSQAPPPGARAHARTSHVRRRGLSLVAGAAGVEDVNGRWRARGNRGGAVKASSCVRHARSSALSLLLLPPCLPCKSCPALHSTVSLHCTLHCAALHCSAPAS